METHDQIYKRTESFLNDIYKKHKNDTVIVVCHGGSKRALLSIIHNKTTVEFGSLDKIHNTSVSEFDVDETGNKKTYHLNCTEHLNK